MSTVPDLSGFDPAELNAVAATLQQLRGFIPLNVRFGAAAEALRYVDVHDPDGRDLNEQLARESGETSG